MKRWIRLFFIMLVSVILLGACKEKSSTYKQSKPELEAMDLLEAIEKEHDEIESVEVHFTNVFDGEDDTSGEGIAKLDFENRTGYFESETLDLTMYKDEDGFIVSKDGMDLTGESDAVIYEVIFDNQMSEYKNPLQYLQSFDEQLYEKFTVSDEGDQYVLTYNDRDENKLQLIQKMIKEYNKSLTEAAGEPIQSEDISVDQLDVEVVIDKETKRIDHFKQDMKYSEVMDGETYHQDSELTYEYVNYNDIGTIEKPVVTDEEKEDDEMTLSKKEKKTYEEEAAAYVDALIQATVFQDEDQYVKKAPGSSKKEKENAAEVQKTQFKEIYLQNTKQNMEGANVTEEDIHDLADAFLGALSKTSYEVVDAKVQSDKEITVTLEVEGIDETALYLETSEELQSLYDEGEITEEEIDAKNIELLVKKYKEIDELSDPVIVDVDVIREANQYFVFMQDQYLEGFVK